MKRTLLMVAALLLAGAPMAKAQDTSLGFADIQEINVEKSRASLAKSDAEIKDAKKGIKPSTWLKRGDVYYAAGANPTDGVFAGLNETVLLNTVGAKTPTEQVTIGNTAYTVYHCENMDAYATGGLIAFAVPTVVIYPNALDVAFEAYGKAYELSPKTAKKVSAGMEKLMNKHIFEAQGFYGLQKYADAASSFYKAYLASKHPSLNKTDTTDIYNAAVLATVGGDYENGLKYVEEAMKLNFYSKGGAYYYKFFCLYKLGHKEESLAVLQDGISAFPSNNDIIESLLMYYTEDPNSNPGDIVPMVRRAIAKDPSNANLHFGLGRVYEKLGQIDKAIEEMRTAVTLNPNDFFASYNLGLFIIEKGNKEQEDFEKLPIPTTAEAQASYVKILKTINETYASSIEPLEAAHAINPTEPSTVELLKNIAFRLRDDSPAMQANFEKYDALFKSMQQK